MDKELAAIKLQGTWEVAPGYQGRTVKSKWAWRCSREPDGEIKFRSRIVARGFSQRPGVDFFESFAPTVSTKGLFALLHIAATLDLEINSLDVSSAYLEADAPNLVYMQLPSTELDANGQPITVKLLKTLYGLRESGYEWNKKLDGILIGGGFNRCQSEPCIYWKRETDGRVTFAAVHVDDIIYAASTQELLTKMKILVSSAVKAIRVTEDVKMFVGLELTRDRAARTITVTQSQYIADMVESEGLTGSRTFATPAAAGIDLLTAPRGEDDSQRRLVGKSRYATDRSHPETLYGMSVLASTQGAAGPLHVAAAKRMISYMGGVKDQGVILGGPGPIALEAWVDASHIEEGEARSQLGLCLRLGPSCGMFFCRSVRDTHVSYSSAESELRGFALATFEVLWARDFLSELGFAQSTPTKIYEDNEAVVTLMTTLSSPSGRTKHVNKLRRTVQQYCDKGDTTCIKTPGDTNIADLFTKNLAADRFKMLSDMACGRA